MKNTTFLNFSATGILREIIFCKSCREIVDSLHCAQSVFSSNDVNLRFFFRFSEWRSHAILLRYICLSITVTLFVTRVVTVWIKKNGFRFDEISKFLSLFLKKKSSDEFRMAVSTSRESPQLYTKFASWKNIENTVLCYCIILSS